MQRSDTPRFFRGVGHGHVLIFLCIAVLVSSGTSLLQAAPVRTAGICVAHPVDLAIDERARQKWVGALCEDLFHFKLSALPDYHVTPRDTLVRYMGAVSGFSGGAPTRQYLSFARKRNIPYCIFQKYEVDARSGRVKYIGEVMRTDDGRIVATIDDGFALSALGSRIDSAVVRILAATGITVPERLTRVFRFPVVGDDEKLLTQCGEVIYRHHYGEPIQYTQLAQKYRQISDQDSRFELAAYRAAQQYINAGAYAKTTHILSNLHEVLPEYGPMYLDYARSLRLRGLLNEALSIARQGEDKLPNSVPLLLEKARVFDAIGNIDQARKVFTEIRGIDSLQPHALLFFARDNLRAGNRDKSISLASQAAVDERLRGAALKVKAEALREAQRPEEAVQTLRRAQEHAPQDEDVYIRLGDLYMTMTRFDDAAASYEKATNYLPDSFAVYDKAARAYARAENPLKALQIYKRIESKFPGDKTLLAQIGLLELQHSGDTAAAFSYLKKAYEKNVDNIEVVLALGHIYLHRHETDQAFRLFNTALSHEHTANEARIGLARLYLQQGKPAEALSHLAAVIKDSASFPGAHRYYAEALLMSGDTTGAIARLNRERRLNGVTRSLLQRLAGLYYVTHQWENAAEEYKKLITYEQERKTGLYRLALVHLHMDAVGQATDYWQQAEKQGKAQAHYYFQAASLYHEKGYNDRAAGLFRECVRQEPDNERAWKKLARIYTDQGKDSLVAETYMKLFSIDNDTYSDELARAGHLFFDMEAMRQARDVYGLYLENGYDTPQVRINLAHIAFDEGDYYRVVELLTPVADTEIERARTHFILGRSHVNVEQYADAIAPLQRVVEAEPRNTEALEALALAAEKAGRLELAADMYQRFLDIADVGLHADYAFTLATLYEKTGRIDKAKARLRANCDVFADQRRHYEGLARLYYNDDEWQRCIEILQQAQRHVSLTAHLKKILGRCYQREGDNDKAILWYRQYLTEAEDDANVWRTLGRLLFEQERFEEAASALTKATQRGLDDRDTWLLLGRAHYRAAAYSDAAEAFEKVRTGADQVHTRVLTHLSRCYEQTGATDKLIGVLQQWAAQEPTDVQVQLRLADILRENQRLDEAGTVLVEANRHNPDNARVLQRAMDVYFTMGTCDRVHTLAKKLLAITPRHPDAHYALAHCYLRAQDSAQARTHVSQAIAASDVHSPSQFMYGRMLLQRGKTDSAYALLTKAVDMEPSNPVYLSFYGYAAALKDEIPKALGAVSTAQKADFGNDVEARCAAARVYIIAGKTVDAKNVVREAITNRQQCPSCYIILGNAYMQEANYKHAVKAYMTAWETGGFNAHVLCNLSQSLILDGKYEEAEDFLKMLIKKRPRHHEGAYYLVHLYILQERLDDASAVVSRYGKKEKTGWYHLMKGEVAEARGDINAAWVSYNVAKRFLPRNAVVFNAAGRIFLEKNEYEKAIVHFGKALNLDPNNPMIQVNLGKAYKAKGDIDAAQELVANVSTRFPHNVPAAVTLARIKGEKGYNQAAVALLQQAREYHDDHPDLYLELGHRYRALQRYDDAEKAYKKAMRKSDRDNHEAFKALGDLYFENMDDPDKAKRFYKKYTRAGGDKIEVLQRLKKMQ
jgi:tetratricopeptide (TPR) repeat protein